MLKFLTRSREPFPGPRHSTSSERGLSVATAEKRVYYRFPAALVAMALMGSAPLPAQDEVDNEQAATADGSEVPAVEPVERMFIRSVADSGALAQQYPHLAVWLEPEDAPRVLGLVEQETTARPSGAMVILSGEGQSANDGLLEGMRSRLSDAGWAVMTLGLEQPSPTLQLARERLADRAPKKPKEADSGEVMIDVNDQAAKELLEAHRKEMNARLTAAVAWFTAHEYKRVVLVGVGRGADEISAFLSQAPEAVTQAAWVAADFGGQAFRGASDAGLGDGALPILDIYASRGESASVRVAALRRAGMSGYESMAAPVAERPGRRDAGAIANRLVGWLDAD